MDAEMVCKYGENDFYRESIKEDMCQQWWKQEVPIYLQNTYDKIGLNDIEEQSLDCLSLSHCLACCLVIFFSSYSTAVVVYLRVILYYLHPGV